MSGLAFSQAPRSSLPMRFLLASSGWGIIAGIWMAWHGSVLLSSRWLPATLVLVHMYVLGVLGNAMIGSLVQFLPVAAGSPLANVRGLAWLFVAFNSGVVLLLVALMGNTAMVAMAAAVLLAITLAGFAIIGLRTILRGIGMTTTRGGIAISLLALLVTVACGLVLLATRAGGLARVPGLANLHAALGVLGWVIGVLVAVAGVAGPMLQGIASPPRYWLWLWYASLLVALLLATLAVIAPHHHVLVPWMMVVPLLLFGLAVLVLQRRSRHSRNPALRTSWRFGSVALVAGGVLGACSLTGADNKRLVIGGLLVVVIGLPMLSVSMALEITAFLTWIDLRRRVPRGQRIAGVGRLMTLDRKQAVLCMQGLAACLLLTAAATSHPLLTRMAGFAVAASWWMATCHQWQCWQQRLHAASISSQPVPQQPPPSLR